MVNIKFLSNFGLILHKIWYLELLKNNCVTSMDIHLWAYERINTLDENSLKGRSLKMMIGLIPNSMCL